MKKMSTKKDEAKKQKTNQYIIGAVLVFLMFGSVFGIVANSFGKKTEEEKYTYGNYELIKQNNYYLLQLGEYSFYFSQNPNEIQTLEKEVNITKTLTNYAGQPLYLSSEYHTSSQEIYQNMNNYVLRFQQACLENGTCNDENLPIKNCENNFIIIQESETNKIYEKENCVFIEGKQEDLTKLTDEFIFRILGVN